MKTDRKVMGVETPGSMKVVAIQDKGGYSLITFQLPNDCKQYLIECALREMLIKSATETQEKYGSVLPEALDKHDESCYNQDTRDDWIPCIGGYTLEQWFCRARVPPVKAGATAAVKPGWLAKNK